jgi:hypothetical protein
MTKTARLIVILTALSLLVLGSAFAAAPIKVFIGGPLVVGDQVFSGGELEIVPLRDGRVLALRLDGRQIALASAGGGMMKAQKVVVKVDDAGYWHLTGLRATATSPVTTLAFDAVTEGLATLRSGPKADEGVASARN